MSLYPGQGLGTPPGFTPPGQWGGAARGGPRNYDGGLPRQNFLTRQFNQGGFRRYGGQQPQPAPQQSTWQDPRRMARDPRLQRGAHPRQQGNFGGGWMSPQRNFLMQRFQRPSWAPQSAQGYRTASPYMQGRGPRYAPPVSPQQQGYNRLADFFRRQVGQPTAPRTMGKPQGQYGRMY